MDQNSPSHFSSQQKNTSNTRLNLDRPSRIPNGRLMSKYPTSQFDFATEVKKLLVEKKFIQNPDISLTELHKYVSPQQQQVDEHLMNIITRSFYDTSKHFRDIYFGLIKYLSTEIFNFDFIFQETPTFRFHFPVPLIDKYRDKKGLYLGHHCDTMLGHPNEEINCWLPLTNCHGSSALLLSPLDISIATLKNFVANFDYDHNTFHEKGRDLFYQSMLANETFKKMVCDPCVPIPMNYGELLFFDPRCIHGPAENKEDITRISIDFRIIPLDAYESMQQTYKSQGRSGRMFTRGDVFYATSARELRVS